MKDSEEKLREQYESRLVAFERERKKLEVKLGELQSLAKILRMESKQARKQREEQQSENDILKETCASCEIHLKIKNSELLEMRDELESLWNQTPYRKENSSPMNVSQNVSMSAANVFTCNHLDNCKRCKSNFDIGHLGRNMVNPTKHYSVMTDDISCVNRGKNKSTQTERKINNSCTDTDESPIHTTATDETTCIDTGTTTPMHLNYTMSSNYSSSYKTLDSSWKASTFRRRYASSACDELPPHQFLQKSFSQKSLYTSPSHLLTDSKSISILRNMLLAQLTSMQLLHTTLDLTANCIANRQQDRQSCSSEILSETKSEIDVMTIKEVDRLSLSTPSGYETGSHSQLDIRRHTFIEETKSRPCTPEYLQCRGTKTIEEKKGNGVKGENLLMPHSDSPPIIDRDSLSIENQILMLDMEIDSQRKAVDEELIRTAFELLKETPAGDDGVRLRKRDVYTKLVDALSNPLTPINTDLLEQLLNLVIVDQSITSCLLALSHRWKNKNTEKMMRRLSSFKSTPKNLVDHISVDQEFYGYENEGAVFRDLNEDEDDIDNVDNVLPFEHSPAQPNITPTTPTMNNAVQVTSDSDTTDSDDGEISSDSDVDTPVAQKKGIRRFFCMPSRSMKVMKSFRKPKKHQEKSLLDDE